ncbi:MAG: hypothetical protein LBC04_02860 [Holosporaceae bacterium]|jgi:hypothetical protein|nr:hypothetical protein [Holosporaceae bacterium]
MWFRGFLQEWIYERKTELLAESLKSAAILAGRSWILSCRTISLAPLGVKRRNNLKNQMIEGSLQTLPNKLTKSIDLLT